MTVETRERCNGHRDVTMVECEFCGEPLGEYKSFPKHWRYQCPENPANG